MASRSRSHLSNDSLRRSLALHLAAERGACAELLADLGEMDVRRLYREDGYASMHDFCVGALGFTSGRAYKRIHVARKARRFPVILDLVAEGKLCLSGAMLLAGHLTEDNARELFREAAGRTVAQIELMHARRFPQAYDGIWFENPVLSFQWLRSLRREIACFISTIRSRLKTL